MLVHIVLHQDDKEPSPLFDYETRAGDALPNVGDSISLPGEDKKYRVTSRNFQYWMVSEGAKITGVDSDVVLGVEYVSKRDVDVSWLKVSSQG